MHVWNLCGVKPAWDTDGNGVGAPPVQRIQAGYHELQVHFA